VPLRAIHNERRPFVPLRAIHNERRPFAPLRAIHNERRPFAPLRAILKRAQAVSRNSCRPPIFKKAPVNVGTSPVLVPALLSFYSGPLTSVR
jgi:hypothetical protein